MNYSIIFYIIGHVLKIEGLLMLVPMLTGIVYKETQATEFFLVGLISFIAGTLITLKKPKNTVFYTKEGLVSVALSWIVLSFVGCIPLYVSGDIPTFTDAFFEMVSGFTTTGSTILKDVEVLSHASLMWRSFSHWIGGMGILVFILTVLPIAGGSTMHIMRAESPGPQVGKIVPKIRETSSILYIIYAVLTILEFVILLLCKVDTFAAITTSFATAGTGGFATTNASLAEYSRSAQYVVAVFMIIFGVNFNVYFLLAKRNIKQALKHEEARWYIGIISIATLVITLNILGMFPIEEAFRHALFQISSIISTTGFATTDYEFFPSFSKEILLILTFVGACAGSTGGGMKVSRIAILIKSSLNEIQRLLHPRTVKKVRIEGKLVEHSTQRSINTYIVAYASVFVLSLLIISLDNFDMNTNFTAIATTINNVGPGFNAVGPSKNFSEFSNLSKYVFTFNMIAGRLEIFPVLILLSPKTWHKPIRLKTIFKNKKA